MHLNPLSASSLSASSAATQAGPRDAAGAPPVFRQPERLRAAALRQAFEQANTPALLQHTLDDPGVKNMLNTMSRKELEGIVMMVAENFGRNTHALLQLFQTAVPRRANDINQIRQGDVYQNYFS